MLEELKKRVFEQNISLVKHGLVALTWGNVSAKDEETGLVVIKPSGVPYNTMKVEDMVVVDIEGNVIEGRYRPSSDLPTHLYLYKQYTTLGGIVHTHSTYATAFAQSGREITAYGTTHADYFYGDIPCTRRLTKEEIENEYEKNTGKVILERFESIDEKAIPAVLCGGHGPFTWGKNPAEAVYHARVLEEVAKMAFYTEMISGNKSRISQYLLDKHYMRKHGKNAYYGQNKE